MCDRAVRAIPRADVAQDHERRGPMVPTFADVGALRFLADRVELELPHQPLDPRVLRPARSPDFQPRRLASRERFRPMPPNYLVKRVSHFGCDYERHLPARRPAVSARERRNLGRVPTSSQNGITGTYDAGRLLVRKS